MRTLSKYAAAAALLTGALAFAVGPAQARWNGHHGHGGWHHGGGAAAAIGFGAGALLGAAAANAYYGPGYYYEPGYAYEPAPYEAAPVYVQPAPQGCWHSTDSSRGYGYYGSCY